MCGLGWLGLVWWKGQGGSGMGGGISSCEVLVEGSGRVGSGRVGWRF